MSPKDSNPKIVENLIKCVRCGLCLGACPIYSIEREEASSPRGRLHIIDRIHNKTVMREFLNNCLLCGSCNDVCPNGVDISSLIRDVREEEGIAREIYSLIKIVQGLDFSSFKIISRMLNVDKNIGGLIKLFAKGRAIPELSSRKIIYSNKIESGTIAIFTGCISKLFYPSAVNKIAEFYRERGYNVYIPEGQLCCGLMNYSAGDTEKATGFIKRNIELFSSENIEKIVTPCASCAYMLKRYGDIFKGGEILSKRVVLLDEDILNEVKKGLQRSGVRVAIHIPCHIRNSKDKSLYKQMKELRSLNNVRIIDSCCGYGGIFNIYEYSKSIKIGEKIIKEIRDSELIYTFCSGCYLQIYDLLNRYGIKKEVLNLTELL